ncbi:MAG: hypothetical protein ABI595_13205 [Actinomycetota bacterium]
MSRLREQAAPSSLRPVFQRTATIGGLTVTSPSDWIQVDYLGLWDADNTSLVGTAVPVIEMTNFDPGLSTPVCDTRPGEPTRLPPDGVAIFVSLGDDGRSVGDLCGGNVEDSSIGTIGPTLEGMAPYRIVMTVGPDVTNEDRTTAQAIWRSIAWTNSLQSYARGQTPRYVLDGWQQGSDWGLLEALPSEQNVELSYVEIGPQVSGSSSVADFGVPQPNAVQGEYFGGAVTEDAARVEYYFERGWTPLEARLIDLPPSLPFAFDVYWFGSDLAGKAASGEVVAKGADGKVLGTNAPPLVATTQVGTIRAFGTTWSVKYTSTADGYDGVGCVEPAAGATRAPCKRPLGGGPDVQTFDAPVPATFVSLFAGVTSVEVRANDGTVFPAVKVDVPWSNGGYVAVIALEGGGSGRLIYHFNGDKVYDGPRVRWPGLGQVIGKGSFPPPQRP